MARNKASANGSQLGDWLEVLGRVQKLVPKLQAERDHHAAELARLDDVLAKLGGMVPAAGVRAARAPRAAAPARADGNVASLIVRVLTDAGQPLTVRELLSGIRAQGGAGDKAVQKALRALRAKGAVKTSGKTKAFRYSLGSAKAAPAPAPAKKKKVAAKPKAKAGGGRQRKDGAPTVREIAVKALAKRPLAIKDLVDAIVAARKDVKRKSAETIIAKLHKDGVLKRTGSKGSFKYTAR